MTKRLLAKACIILGIVSCGLLMAMAASGPEKTPSKPTTVTYYKDVLPILQNNCQSCHRPGEVAPMSLRTFEETRPWATAIKTSILTKKMPPWFADPKYGHFENERKLTPAEIKTLVSWADAGAPEGNKQDAPAPVEFTDGWNIGKPDRVLEMPAAFSVPAQGTVDYQYVVIPGNFKEDMWIRAAEVRPGNRALLHHVIAFVRPPGSKWLTDVQPGTTVALKPQEEKAARDAAAARAEGRKPEEGGVRDSILGAENLVGYAPGLQPLDLQHDSAILVRAGSDIVLQLHYTANGTAGTDKTKVGLIFAKNPPKTRQLALAALNRSFAIPPNDDNYEVKSAVEIQQPVTLVYLMPHMHYRGKDFVYKITYPDGQNETLLSVPNYDFNWQLGYKLEKPLELPKGTRIECTAHFDNSANNLYNPDPKSQVKWGEQTWEEMMIGFFSVNVPADEKLSRGLIKFLPGSTKASAATPASPDAKTAASTGSGTSE
ncbi:MAG TPA: thiol-disulfide isomerase [Candidatus Angelobacter sp.]|nr:thiol-disulfide isomerase [Candidatus Angelobacter sp.]